MLSWPSKDAMLEVQKMRCLPANMREVPAARSRCEQNAKTDRNNYRDTKIGTNADRFQISGGRDPYVRQEVKLWQAETRRRASKPNPRAHSTPVHQPGPDDHGAKLDPRRVASILSEQMRFCQNSSEIQNFQESCSTFSTNIWRNSEKFSLTSAKLNENHKFAKFKILLKSEKKFDEILLKY